MAAGDRMSIEELVRQVLRDEHEDVIRASVRAVAGKLTEDEVSELAGAGLGERRPGDGATHLTAESEVPGADCGLLPPAV
jgi:hypothetical protein